MGRLKESLSLVGIGIAVRWYNLKEYAQTVWRYYRRSSFAAADLLLLSTYWFRNPFTISRRFLKARGEENVYAYGETPLTTMERVADLCELGPDDVFFELGCGRGRSCLWMREFRGCQVVGVDFIPAFIKTAAWVTRQRGISSLQFVCRDMADMDYRQATAVYLYGTGFSEVALEKLLRSLKKLPKGAKVITVSYPLTEYRGAKGWLRLDKAFTASFPWGVATIYLQMVSNSGDGKPL